MTVTRYEWRSYWGSGCLHDGEVVFVRGGHIDDICVVTRATLAKPGESNYTADPLYCAVVG